MIEIRYEKTVDDQYLVQYRESRKNPTTFIGKLFSWLPERDWMYITSNDGVYLRRIFYRDIAAAKLAAANLRKIWEYEPQYIQDDCSGGRHE